MVNVTRTLHPLPFEHLEPKRFEDLIRQLAYEFRTWRSLEATGAGGGDESFDIRGLEAVTSSPDADVDDAEEIPEDDPKVAGLDRLWLIQCKREQKIGPGKLLGYLNEIHPDQIKELHGIIIAASCTFSKQARDAFILRCGTLGLSECYLWSRNELEDMLFQPKNDGLLFAYFGFSLTIRRRSAATSIRSRLAAKRKALRALGDGQSIHKHALFLDVNAENYPYREHESSVEDLPWRVYNVIEHHPRGILLEVVKAEAFVSDDGVYWDAADQISQVNYSGLNRWMTDEEVAEHQKLNDDLQEFLKDIRQTNQATLTFEGLLNYERIIDIDANGDSCFRGPIVYVEFAAPGRLGVTSFVKVEGKPIFRKSDGEKIGRLERSEVILHPSTPTDNRIVKFPEHLRKKW